MAWYRAGGGGIPSSLKTDMNDVLNKKFGTSQDYPPTDWAPTVNLMGPLPEKTVSGAIATFADGADAVPTKSLVVTIPPTLSGVSSVSETQTGKNLLDDSQRYKNGGNIFFGGATSNTEVSLALPAGTYTMTLKNVVNENVNLYLKNLDANAYVSGFPSYNSASTDPKSKTFTLSQETRLCAWAYNANYTGTSDIDFCQIEVGSSFASYTAYTAPTTYTALLGRTIYGGTADIVNGTAEPTNYLDTANAETNTNNSVSITCDGNGKYTATGTATGGSANITFTLKTPCEIKSGMYLHLMNSDANSSASITLQKQDNTTIYAPTLSPANRIADLSSYAGQTIHSIRFYVANGASFEMTLTPMLCYSSAVTPYSPYFEPFTFDGQEINTRLGYNAFWSDDGDTEVTYRADINLALGGQ